MKISAAFDYQTTRMPDDLEPTIEIGNRICINYRGTNLSFDAIDNLILTNQSGLDVFILEPLSFAYSKFLD